MTEKSLEWVGKSRHLIVGGDQLEKVDGDKHLSVKGNHNEKVDGTVSVEAGMDMQEKVGMKYALDAGMEIHHKAGMSAVIEAATNLTLKVGGNFININPGGGAGPLDRDRAAGPAGRTGCGPAVPYRADRNCRRVFHYVSESGQRRLGAGCWEQA